MLPEGTPLGRLRVVRTYVYHDGPRVFLAESTTGDRWLAVCTDATVIQDSWLYLRVSETRVEALELETVTLRAAMQAPEGGGLFRVALMRGSGTATVQWCLPTEVAEEELPDDDFVIGLALDADPYLAIRISGGETGLGDAPVSVARKLFNRVEDLVRIAARTAAGRQPYFSSLGAEAGAYASWARVRPAAGSLLLLIEAPSPSHRGASLGDPSTEHALRLLALGRALQGARAAVDATVVESDYSPFEEQVERSGLSANVCAALADIVDTEKPIEVKFQLVGADDARASIRFGSGDKEALRGGSEHLRYIVPVLGVSLVGPVSKLFAKEGEWELRGGEVAVSSQVDGRQRLVRLFLTPDLYEIALQAHAARLPVRAVGSLSRVAGGYRLRQVQAVELLDPVEVTGTMASESNGTPRRLYVRLTQSDTTQKSGGYVVLPKAAVMQHPGFFGYPPGRPTDEEPWRHRIMLRELDGLVHVTRFEWWKPPGEFRLITSLRNDPRSYAGCFMELVREQKSTGFSVALHRPGDPQYAEIEASTHGHQGPKPFAWG